MYSTISTRLTHEPAREILVADIKSYYVPVGDKIDYPVRQILYQNDTDEDIWFSFNGIDNGFFLRAGQDFVQDITINQVGDKGLLVPAGDYLYVKQRGIPTLGSVSVTIFYGQD